MTDTTAQPVPVEGTPDQAEEIQNVIDEQVTGEAAVVQDEKEAAIAAGDMKQLESLEVALEHLGDLRSSIQAEGVSAEDIRTLLSIRERVRAQGGIELPLSPSMEQFGDKLFMQTRSDLGVEVSQESIVTTVIDTIKKWLNVFKEWIIKGIRFLKIEVSKDDVIARRVDDALTRVKEIRIATKELAKMIPHQVDTTGMAAYAKDLLADKTLKRNALTLAALGDIDQLNHIRTLHSSAMGFTEWLDKHLTSIDAFVRGQVDSLPYVQVLEDGLMRVNTEMGLLRVESPDKNYLNNQVSILVDNKLFLPRQTFGYVASLKTYYRSVDFVRLLEKDLRQANAPDEILMEVSQQLALVSRCYGVLENIVKFFTEYNKIQLQVLALMYKYANKEYTLVWEEFSVTEILSDNIQRKADEIDRKLRAFLKVQFRA